MKHVPIFFLNIGRSGSTAIAKHFNGFHEPDGYLPNLEKTKKRIEQNPIYIDSSHYWKFCLDKLPENAIKIHLVRNPRNVIKSFEKKRHLYRPGVGRSDNNPLWGYIQLPIWKFNNMTRFEKICWYYRYFNEKIEEVADYRIKLEELNIPVENKGRTHSPWTDEEEKMYKKTCSNIAKKYGYS